MKWFLVLLLKGISCLPTHPHSSEGSGFDKASHEQLPAVRYLQEYIRIDSTKIANYDLVVEFWMRRARELDVPLAVYRPAGLPVCVLTLAGARPDLPSIMLNSHSDVVPAYDSQWKYPPFSAFIDSNGDLYGRGAQDTKSLAIQQFEALKQLKGDNVTLLRTVHLTVMPDEEVGGFRGMKAFIASGDFHKLNVGFALDEGYPSKDHTYLASYLDRRPWQINMTLYGTGGHGSEIRDGGVIEKLDYLLNYILHYQRQQKQLMTQGDNVLMGRYTSCNVNIIKAGIAANVIPSVLSVVIDIRLAVDASVADMQAMVNTWQEATGPGTTVQYLRRDDDSPATAIDGSNPYWLAMQDAAADMNITLKASVCPATTDMLPVRKLGVPAIGFAPNVDMMPRLHANNEYIPVGTFLRGIQLVKGVIMKVASVSPP